MDIMYKIEIWQWGNMSDVYEADDIQDVLAWFRYSWYAAYDNGNCSFGVYKNGIKIDFDELYELRFYD